MNNQQLMAYFKESSSVIDVAMEEDLAGLASPLLSDIIRHALFSGGKRIRPQLTILTHGLMAGAAGGESGGVRRLAIVFEYLHAASLLHDDIIDHADLRRGRPTANSIWGDSAVVLAGDFLHARALSLAGETCGEAGVALAGRATEAMIEAEFLQIALAEGRDVSVDGYCRVVGGKTGALIAAACEAGVVLAGGGDRQRRAVRGYGEKLGLAFQIIDDLLDYQGDPAVTGKAVGNDWLEGKMSLPLIYAMDRAGREERAFFERMLAADSETRRQGLRKAQVLMDSLGSFAEAGGRAERVVGQALSDLSLFPEGFERQVLEGLAGYVLRRDK